MQPRPTAVFADSKRHYPLLDALRGVAALVVVVFHLFEAFNGGNHLVQIINHGYLAVDFFFLLSGFVIGYAYDDRWGSLTLGSFFKRRLIRLHPMIVMGMIVGAVCYYFSASPVLFPRIADTPLWQMLLVMLVGFTLVPLPVSMDIRGWTEMHPLNGLAWSLFFEYIANLLYALLLRRLPNAALALLVALAGAALLHLGLTSPYGDVIGGWSLDPVQLRVGFTWLLYPFLAGLLLARTVRPGRIRHAFWWSDLLLVAVLAMLRIGGSEQLWLNGFYDALVILLVFPLIVYIGASGSTEGSSSAAQWLGDISYPLYITHYPLIYIYTAWVVDHQLSIPEAVPAALLTFAAAVALAHLLLKLYDEPAPLAHPAVDGALVVGQFRVVRQLTPARSAPLRRRTAPPAER
ncbi:MAG: acyltransferase [Bacteroidia bacterium]